MKNELQYYAKGVLTTALISAVLAPLFMYLATPGTGAIDPRTGDIVIDPQPVTIAIPAAVVTCFVIYGFYQFFRHRPTLRIFRGLRILGLCWAITLLPSAALGIGESVWPPSISGPFNNSMFCFSGMVFFVPALCLELLGMAAFLLLGGGKAPRQVRRIDPRLAKRIQDKLS